MGIFFEMTAFKQPLLHFKPLHTSHGVGTLTFYDLEKAFEVLSTVFY